MQHIGEFNALEHLNHDLDWHAARSLGVGGSDAVKIVKGVREELEVLRLEKLGRSKSDDLSRVLPVQMGSWTEPLNRLWLTYAIDMTVTPGTNLTHPVHKFMRANIDGEAGDGGIVECKHVNSFSKMDDVVTRYYAQFQHNMVVSETKHCYASVFIGSDRFEWRKIERDNAYIDSMIAAERTFWTHVEMDMEIDSAKTIDAPIIVPVTRDVDMRSSNSWSIHASNWLMLKDQAKEFEAAGKELKALMEPDMRRGHGCGIEIIRDGRGCTIKELKAKKEAA